MHPNRDDHPKSSYDIAVIGAGLAGMLCAYELSKTKKVLLLDPRGIAGGTSGMASGMVNPMMSQKANPVWNWEACIDAFEKIVHESNTSNHYRSDGVIRPAKTPEQAGFFKAQTEKHSQLADWLDNESSIQAYPNILSPHGSLFVKRGGSIDIKGWLEELLLISQKRNLEFRKVALKSWNTTDLGFQCVDSIGYSHKCDSILLCLGSWNELLGEERADILHSIKGQAIELSRPVEWPETPTISGPSYVITQKDRLIVGSTYEHEFRNLEIDPESTIELMERAALVNPILAGEKVIEEWVGVRITKPGSRLPYFTEIEKKVFSLGALGSKGILLGSYISGQIADWISGEQPIPNELTW